MRVFKYPLQFEYQNSALGKVAVWEQEQTIELPLGSRPISVQFQNGVLCLWAEVDDTTTDKEKFYLEIVGTGHPLTDELKRHISTVQDESLVFHIFEVYKGINKEDIIEEIIKEG